LDKVNQAVDIIGKDISKLKITCLGLAFKPDIDDLRESPALSIAGRISLMGFSKVLIVEPNISGLPKEFKDKPVDLVSVDEAIRVADIVVLLVDHTPFKSTNLSLLSGKQIIDTRGIWS
jgi:UDP-N-acetyl-D-mannosaminuronic acid dehydrogenase